ncbi:hypothetical protein BCR32DRAFT_269848 [Anaeromyces robustus]|uniref:Uncharacterized protein n=1 Tax=Anaeromyces robustus TaxID=1754192 RepID=A0A1Y1WZ67_9FUNG|nr:hypothetical protein BCR32DRAFT_269848 [Anaeromyces robustus]|eukprot:ORX78840.1 hypothetical protein BCR32DRAFT_269848 [Anaeromyces robustus]
MTMTNNILPINSSKIKTCDYENCKNQFIRRSNNHKYCKEHEKINNRKDKIKNKKRKYRDENESLYKSSNINNIVNVSNAKNNNISSIKKEINESVPSFENNTLGNNSKKSNLLDILLERTNSGPFSCIGKNKTFHNNIPQKVDKCIQTDDLFEFIPKNKKVKVDKSVGTDIDIVIEPSSPLLDVLTAQQYSSLLDTPTKNIQSIKSPISIKRSIKSNNDNPLRDISNIINYKYLKSPISDRKSPKNISKSFKFSEFDNKNKENININTTPVKQELNIDSCYNKIVTNESISFLPSTVSEEGVSTYDKEKDIFGQPINYINKDKEFFGQSITTPINNTNLNNINDSGSNSHTIPVDYYMEYIKILKKISKFSPSQELKQTLSSNSNLTSINNHNILSPAKTDAEDLLNWLNIE